MLPREYPPWQTVYYHFRKWRLDGRLRQAHERLREAVREAQGRNPDPSGAVIDSQVVKGSGVGGPERGYDGAKRLSGRKRHLLVDTNGLVLSAHVHAASLHDRDGAQKLLNDELAEKLPRLAVLWADAAYTGRFRSWVRDERGWRVEVPRHPDRQLWRYVPWRRNRAASRCCRGGGWWRGHSRGWGKRGGWPRTTSDCRRPRWP